MLDPVFDLRIESSADDYVARADAPSVGHRSRQPYVPSFDPAELPRRRRDAGEWVTQARVRRMGPAELRQAREFGVALFNSVFRDQALIGFREALAQLGDGDRQLRLRLHVPSELALVPWELLYDPDPRQNRYLAHDPRLTLARDPQLGVPVALRPRTGPLRVVVVLASPTDRDQRYTALKVDLERQIVESALGKLRAAGQVQVDIISGRDTRGQLSRRLRDPAHVLHLFCHGDLDSETREGELIFENVDGERDPVNAGVLRQLVQRQRQELRLVVLNACLATVPADGDPVSSVGMAVLQAGVPAVVAMQFEWPEAAAGELSRTLYEELAAGARVDRAVAQVRQHLYARFPGTLDWVVPVLFLRAEPEALFVAGAVHQAPVETTPARVAAASPDVPPLPPISTTDPRLLRARARATIGKWAEALPLYEALATQFTLPANRQRTLERARAEVWQATQRSAIDAATVQGDWSAVIALLEGVQQRVPDDPQVVEQLRQARAERELDELAHMIAALAEDSDWEGVADLFGRLRQLRAGYAHRSIDLAQIERAAGAARALREALEFVERQDWAGVVEVIDALPAETHDDDLRVLLAHARGELTAHERRAAEAEAQRRLKQQREAEARERRKAEARERTQRARLSPVLEPLDRGAYTEALDAVERLLGEERGDGTALQFVVRVVEDRRAPLVERLRAGWLLAKHGNPRPGVCTLPQSLDDLYWVALIPANTYPIAGGQARIALGEFRIARYPVTVWQFRRFWDDPQGYENQRHWSKNGWAWKSGSKTRQPYLWSNADWNADNEPVIGVSWYEAIAFCRWLNSQVTLPDGWAIRLPSEAEWEVAAGWDVVAGAMQPWAPPAGEIWQNVKETRVGRTCPVGLFPRGASPCGALDMAGNAWEWCGSLYSDYPQQSARLRKDFAADQFGPAMRGGDYYVQNTRSGWGAR